METGCIEGRLQYTKEDGGCPESWENGEPGSIPYINEGGQLCWLPFDESTAHSPATVGAGSNPALGIDVGTQVLNLNLDAPDSFDPSNSPGVSATTLQGTFEQLAALTQISGADCNAVSRLADGLYVRESNHQIFTIGEPAAQMGAPVYAQVNGALPDGTDISPINGNMLLVNPSDCSPMDFLISGSPHATLENGDNAGQVGTNRTSVLLEIDTGAGFFWIGAKQASNIPVTGEQYQDYHYEHYVTVGAGQTLNVSYQIRVIVIGTSANINLWPVAMSVVGVQTG